ncbi:MAG TPA: serine/threonine-protein kinase, partial [Candidatus Obscuribacterales bacterium]
PTHVALTEEGLQLHWLRSWLNATSPVIPWSRLSHVSLSRDKTAHHVQSKVEFNIIARGIPFRDRLPFFLIAPHMSDGWLSSDRAKIILLLDGLASSDDRKRLQFGFQRFLPSYRLEPEVSDELNLALHVQSYTDLWLDALSQFPSRIRSGTLSAGAQLGQGRYQIVSTIGSGGQAIVYLASMVGPYTSPSRSHSRSNANAPMKTDAQSLTYVQGTNARERKPSCEESDRKTVVLKEFVLPSHAGVNVRKRVLQNIQRESEMLKALQHPNIVKLLDFFVEDQRAYLVLEQIKGVTLKQYVDDKGPIKEQEAISFGLQLCSILSYLHGRKPPVIHRDFTPDNLMLAHGDIIKLIDFNVAQHLESASTKSVVGKHAYIPPEQFRGEATSQSDIYALGATMYYLLTGYDPEPISASFPKEKRKDLSDEINQIVGKATATDAAYRYQSCESLKTELEELRRSRYGV